ncbi:MAG: hypothetical protein IKV85_02885 [Ruminococcus sp.]|nr:hypothetical protein [Ruminococcus sp.]
MDMLSLLTLAAVSPATGDRFPVLPLILVAGLAIVIAVVSSVIASKNKHDDDDDEE